MWVKGLNTRRWVWWLLPVVAAVAATGCREASAGGRRMVVLGIDGMDPAFLERHWEALPELDRLRREGEFKRLGTTIPPQSPVAWSTFITGLDPESHGVFDFVHRDPETLAPYSSLAQTVDAGRRLAIGPYLLPLTGERMETRRRGTPFWKALSDRGVPVVILRMPTDFPPMECGAHSLAGMGTPDLRGTFGTYTFFTTDGKWKDRQVSGGEVVTVRLENHGAVLRVPGPANSLRKDQRPTFAEIRATVDPSGQAALFEVEGRRVILNQGEWSEWIPVRFELIPALADLKGMVRIYARRLRPELEIYVSPVHIDPREPAMPVSAPEEYSQELARRIGPFHTLGMPYDTGALRSGVFTLDEYQQQSRMVSEEAARVLDAALEDFREGLLFFHFFGIDQDSHMYWGKHEDRLLETYKMVDRMIGRVRSRIGDATLVVMSDHGFAAFDRSVHLNTWLKQEGFLALEEGETAGEMLEGVDWSGTRAYSMGLNAIYVNQQFRERNGIVAEGEETVQVLEAIRERLLALRDPKTGQRVVHSVALGGEFHAGTFESAPDMIVGYYPGYRSSWQTALGAAPSELFEDNRDEWRGDHCIGAEFVPGVLLSNRPSAVQSPRLADLAVTILEEFGAGKIEGSEGADIYRSARAAQ